jgi:hypothetical protein
MGSLLVTRFFDLFECPDPILHGGLGIRIAANGHFDLKLSNPVPRVFRYWRMGELCASRVIEYPGSASHATTVGLVFVPASTKPARESGYHRTAPVNSIALGRVLERSCVRPALSPRADVCRLA